MAKNIAVFLDGTWNNAVSTSGQRTNVDALHLSLSRKNQVNLYCPGVGAHAGWLGKRLFGVAGKGVFQAARHAWKDVAANYESGDRIYIFGFSRGAFAARHLAGMIVRYGLGGWQGDLEQQFRKWLRDVAQPCVTTCEEVHFLGLFDCVPGNRLYVLAGPLQAPEHWRP